ncbi:hypothetical protein T484DRAFT_1823452, partial [Baffinella frigidus]
MTKPRLHSLPPTWGLPTFHPDFLKVHAYLKLSGTPFENVPTTTASAMSSFEQPVMEADEKVLTGSDEITQHLRAAGHDLDAQLSQQQRADLFAFSSMIERQLLDAMLYDWYLVEDNYFQIVRPLYVAAASFPANLVLPWQV